MIHNFEALNISHYSRTAHVKCWTLCIVIVFGFSAPQFMLKNCKSCMHRALKMYKYFWRHFLENEKALIWISLWCDHNLCQLWSLRDWGLVLSKLGFVLFSCFTKTEISCNVPEGSIRYQIFKLKSILVLVHT